MDENHTFRVFISSTFSDLKCERNYLNSTVFKKIRDLCSFYGCHFQAIDLRWGISQEAGLDQRTLEICLEEIKRCQKTTPKPNFIILLGDRYGWVPLPTEIEKDEWTLIIHNINHEEKEALSNWYSLDENAKPAHYTLNKRELHIPEDCPKDSKATYYKKEADQWNETERTLQSIFLRAIDNLNWKADDHRLCKYELSAIHHEIINGVLDIDDAAEHVFCFNRKIENIQPPSLTSKYIDMVNGQPDHDAHNKLNALKAALRSKLGANWFDCRANWGGSSFSDDHLGTLPVELDDCFELLDRFDQHLFEPKTLSEIIWCGLGSTIRKECLNKKKSNSLDVENDAHIHFRQKHTDFLGRDDCKEIIDQSLNIKHSQPLVFAGSTGSGKSALLCDTVNRILSDDLSNKLVIERYIGVTPKSTSLKNLLTDLHQQIEREFGNDAASYYEDIFDLFEDFQQSLHHASEEKPIYLILDSIELLSAPEQALSLSWLPQELPQYCYLILSCDSENKELIGLLKQKHCHIHLIQPLEKNYAEKLLESWLAISNRTLTEDQKKWVLNYYQESPYPLFLKLLFNEAKQWQSSDTYPYALIEQYPHDIEGLMTAFISQLSTPEFHGSNLVLYTLGYLSHSRHGLTENEVIYLLSNDSKFFNDFAKTGQSFHTLTENALPISVWSRLYYDLHPFLQIRKVNGTYTIDFVHEIFRSIIKRFVKTQVSADYFHLKMSHYFSRQPTLLNHSKRIANRRKLSELPFQQTESLNTSHLCETLTDMEFLEAKIQCGDLIELFKDYLSADRIASEIDRNKYLNITAFYDVIKKQSKLLSLYPEIFFQQCANEPANSFPSIEAARRWLAGIETRTWLKLNQVPSKQDIKVSIQFDLEKPLSQCGSATLHKVYGCSRKGMFEVIDLANGQTVFKKQLNEFILNIKITDDGQYILAVNIRRKLLLIDSNTLTLIKPLGILASQDNYVTRSHCIYWISNNQEILSYNLTDHIQQSEQSDLESGSKILDCSADTELLAISQPTPIQVIKIYNIKEQKFLFDYEPNANVSCLQFMYQSPTVVIITSEMEMTAINIETREQEMVAIHQMMDTHTIPVQQFTFSTDDRYLALITNTGNIYTYEFQTQTLNGPMVLGDNRAMMIIYAITTLQNQMLYIGSINKNIMVGFDLKQPETTNQTVHHNGETLSVHIINKSLVASVGKSDRTIFFCHRHNLEVVSTGRVSKYPISVAATLHDHSGLILADIQGNTWLEKCDFASSNPDHTLQVFDHAIEDIISTKDGHTIFAGTGRDYFEKLIEISQCHFDSRRCDMQLQLTGNIKPIIRPWKQGLLCSYISKDAKGEVVYIDKKKEATHLIDIDTVDIETDPERHLFFLISHDFLLCFHYDKMLLSKIWQIAGSFKQFRLDEETKLLAALHQDGWVSIFESSTGKQICLYPSSASSCTVDIDCSGIIIGDRTGTSTTLSTITKRK